jgi:TRAP-type mannitol/chloroaromatic compound transport system substrate-binding protein
VGSGTQLKAFPRPVMDACFKAAQEVYAETNAKNAEFKKLSDHYFAFQRDQITWFRVTENTFDDYMATARR